MVPRLRPLVALALQLAATPAAAHALSAEATPSPTSTTSTATSTTPTAAPTFVQVHLTLDGDDRADAADNDRVRGALVRDLVDAGFVVVSAPERATHLVAITKVGGAWAISVSGSESRSAIVDDGAPALTELEVKHRVRALVHQTARKEGVAAVADAVVVDAVARRRVVVGDHVSVDRGDDVFVGALVRAGANVGDAAHAVARACFDADDVRVSVGLGVSCDEVGFDVDAADAGDAARALWRMREPPPPPAPPPTPALPVTTTQTPPPEAPPPRPVTSLHLELGALARVTALDAALVAHVEVPVVDVGDFRVGVLGVVDGSGTLSGIVVGEGVVAVGPSLVWLVGDRLRLSTGVATGVWLHAWYWSGTDAGIAFDPAIVVPVHVVVPITRSLGVSLGLSAGAMARARTHVVSDVGVVWERGAGFVAGTGGVVFDW